MSSVYGLLCISLLTLGLCHAGPQGKKSRAFPSDESIRRAKEILDKTPIIDGHNDFVMGLRSQLNNDLTDFDFNSNLSANEPWASYYADHTDIPRAKEGRLGGQFWSSYIKCNAQYEDAVQLFMEQNDVIKRLVAKNPDTMSFVTTAAGIEQAFAEGKIASMIGVESGHAMGSSLAILRMMYDTGVRYMTLTHGCNTPWADAAQSETGELPVRSNGLSNFGREVVLEMNRLGMLVDLSHVSAKVMSDALDVTRSPVIFSHSSSRSVTNHARNVPDDILERVATNGGIVMVNFFSCFIIDNCSSDNRGDIYDVVEHINRVRDVAGVDHVGIGSDYCGIRFAPNGLEDSSKYPNLFAALLEDGWSEGDLGKLASNNLIRVWKENEGVRDFLSIEAPHQAWIPDEDMRPEETGCKSELD